MIKKVLIISLILLLVVGGLWFKFWKHSVPSVNMRAFSQSSTTSSSPASQPNTIRLLAAGDFIAHDSINNNSKQSDGSYNYLPMMSDFTPIFHKADIRFCNDANLNGGPAFGISGYPKFNSPTEFVRDMGRVGCNMVNTGTNHSFDRNQATIDASIDAWKSVPDALAVVGQNHNAAEHDLVHTFTVKGVKFAFLAYTTYLNTDAPAQNNYGVNVYSNDFAARQIQSAKQQGAQIIIASVRWGTEYSGAVTSQQKTIAQFLADHGVDLILGHGSHVLEPVQQLTGSSGTKTTVWYSLGNFLNTQEPAETLFNGIAVIDFDTKSLQVTKMSFLPIYMHYEWTATEAKAENLAARHNIKMYLLDDATQSMIDQQQLATTAAAQRDRLQKTLDTYTSVPLISLSQYDQ